jgi:hypothetical protein
MAMTDAQLLAASQAAYERGRWQLAALAGALVAALPALSTALGTNLPTAVLVGGALIIAVAVLVQRGGVPAISAYRGLVAGLIPLALAHLARTGGHICTPGGCTSWCVPACAAGGIAAGLLLEWSARRTPSPWTARGLGAGICVLTGALGCSCAGRAGIAGLILALGITLTAGAVIAPLRRS